jgi:predicted 3-demethylubiquinone-9 3-methyltransferase (glyoxalase superfamily)
MQKITPFLMFDGNAEEALRFYVSLFPDSEILSLTRYEEGGGGAAGSVQHALFALNGQRLMCIDSTIKHGFGFTPALSLFVPCDSEEEVDTLFAALSKDGEILMPLDAYPFSKRFAWISDRFGVSWQLMFSETVVS